MTPSTGKFLFKAFSQATSEELGVWEDLPFDCKEAWEEAAEAVRVAFMTTVMTARDEGIENNCS